MGDEPLGLDEYRALVEARIPARGTATKPLDECLGLTLASDAPARIPVPPFTNSAMDGFAVRRVDVAGASPEHPVRLPVIADVPAGDPAATPLRPGTAERIMTGAMMPAGADTVIRVEETDHRPGTDRAPEAVTILRGAEEGANVRRAGEDVEAGDPVLTAGIPLDAVAIAAAASVGHTTLEVVPRPRVGVLATGSELREAGDPLGPGQIPDSNSHLLAGLVREAGCEPVEVGRAPDDPAKLLGLLAQWPALDLVITAGGISAGAYEVVRQALSGPASRFHRVAQQPGGPQGVGSTQVGAGGRETPVICLPGNPVSVFTTFHMYVAGALAVMSGLVAPEHGGTVPSGVIARARVGWDCPSGKTQFIPLRFVPGEADEAGARWVEPVHPLGSKSHLVASLANAEAIGVVAPDVEAVEAGQELAVVPLVG